MRRAVIILACFLAACSSTGTRVSQQTFDAFEKGKTHCNEITARLGQPTQFIKKDNGDLVLAYSYSAAQAHPENFIPIAGAFVAGYDIEHSMALFKCDSNNVLIKTAYIGGGSGMGMNMESVGQDRKDTGTAE